MHGMVNIAIRAAREAGEIMIRQLNHLETLSVSEKSNNEYVTEIDKIAEKTIINIIHEHFPDHSILGEEFGKQGDNEYQWIIDPIDGTTNFIHGFPVFCVSIAVTRDDELEHGVVYDPLRQEIFSASKGQGSQLDGHKIRVSKTNSLKNSLIATGFPYRSNKDKLDEYLKTLKNVIQSTSGIRRPGSAALDLCYVACGRVDGFWEFGLRKWDVAAGALIIKEAGGIITNLIGESDYLENGNILAGNPKIHSELLEKITI
ncbi:MAG: inositol monophosphatase [Gammaproteobacteria bacterium TMED78]|nr:MAG: inositol monophosphatase [Gammaproteobacteria bacterium TMED78]